MLWVKIPPPLLLLLISHMEWAFLLPTTHPRRCAMADMVSKPTNNASDTSKCSLLTRLADEATRGGYQHFLFHTPLILGVSGGPDSVALLHALHQLRGTQARDTLLVAHFNHHLREESSADQDFVQELAAGLQIPFISGTGDVAGMARAQKLSLEDAARRARYSFFGDLAGAQPTNPQSEAWAVAVAHTADDQAETVLMSILRGSGLPGLAGMQPLSRLPTTASTANRNAHRNPQSAIRNPQSAAPPPAPQPPLLFRPMLGVWREEVIEYLTANNLPYREDHTNSDTRFTRNRVRHELIPIMSRDYNPAVKPHLVTLANIATEENSYIESIVDHIWTEIAQLEADNAAIRIDPARFAQLHHALQLRAVRRAFALLMGGTHDLDFGHTSEAAALLASPDGGELHLGGGLMLEKRPYWSGVRHHSSRAPLRAALREYGQLWPLLDPDTSQIATPNNALQLPSGWVCETDTIDNLPFPMQNSQTLTGNYTAAFDLSALGSARLVLRTRRIGDRITPLGMSGSKSLKDLFIDAKIPKIIRNRAVVVAHPDTNEPLWVPGPDGHRSTVAKVETGSRVLRLHFIRVLNS